MKSNLKTQWEQRLAAVSFSLGILVAAHGGPALGPSHLNFPSIQLNGIQRGQAAIDGLGWQLPAVAQAYGITPTELNLRLKADRTLAIDPRGRLLYTDFETEVTSGQGGGSPVDPSEQIPSPPVRTLEGPVQQIPSPPVRTFLNGVPIGDPSGQIPSPPVRTLLNGGLIGEDSEQIPSPPVRTFLNGAPIGDPSGQIPSPPVRTLLNGGLIGEDSEQIPSPPVRTLLNGAPIGDPSGQIPSPPVRTLLNGGLIGEDSEQIPSPPVRTFLNGSEAGDDTGVGEVEMAAPTAADAFRLHSRPESKRTIYLDFNGEVLSGNAWTELYNGGTNIVAGAYDLDGSPTTFNETERTRIIQIWQRVAEDYAPFDVDVTTELTSEGQLTRSSGTDEFYGVRVLISPMSKYIGNYGGVSYVGTFNDVGDFWKPSLVFSDTLGANSDKNIAEAASHEAGHALGLSHDGLLNGSSYYSGNGTGETGWAPIMGVGYSKNVTQWSRGEYAGANNTQDDLTVMQTYGLTPRVDDHGDTAAVASYFAVGTQLLASGIIERNTDVDVFAFSAGAGPLVLVVSPQAPGPNLDIRAELRNSAGVLVATSNPTNSLSASFNLNVPAGTYFLSLRGDGKGTPSTTGYSTYGSLGQYLIAGSVTYPVQPMSPVAVADSDTVSGTAPLPVSFNGSQSFDTDGNVVSYAWDFGDGTGASGAVVNHTYLQAGSYLAALTVTDNSGLKSTNSLMVEVVNPVEQRVVRVKSISTSTTPSGSGVLAWAAVRVTDPAGNPVAGATVTGRWVGIAVNNKAKATDQNGLVEIASKAVAGPGTMTFSITKLELPDYTYDPSLDVQSTASIVISAP